MRERREGEREREREREGERESTEGGREEGREGEREGLTLPAGLRWAKRHFTACAGRVM